MSDFPIWEYDLTRDLHGEQLLEQLLCTNTAIKDSFIVAGKLEDVGIML